MSGPVSDDLLHEVLAANLVIPREGLATLTWGNVSGVDRDRGVYVIKPSGVPYDELALEHLVPVEVETGRVLAGDLKPSTDSETHRLLYLEHAGLGGVAHTHSMYAVSFAQAGLPVPMLGTTHADTFNGPVPITRTLTAEECGRDYELNTGRVLVEAMGADALGVPGALVAGHGPFTWGATAAEAVEHSVILEAVAEMAMRTLTLNPAASSPDHLFARHFTRKHGPDAYYGNPDRTLSSPS
ncbi:L-ribulose-5-phosphate 4-epimerase AraD [Nocardioides sp. zg-1228]|uniref:L-ribulose-5-phosphate 4-epimerase AraD n=1 Tax=Nocardioides sp. zg-1228 TaxID=2763008 RepID=UPI0016423D1C|nr:L-ribulose-5-phosphate 4-epimerase AraD [Nocardioides sp. zg-1228]MBC2932497.1 L-ribulose-5-phosphate 4-epimerase AraD [Nocardioides sp. zg-1228]QSF58001.1 L-ribulose-5-phosphate 4-epimerase AraD [Nocardioides sp. zg-1228]